MVRRRSNSKTNMGAIAQLNSLAQLNSSSCGNQVPSFYAYLKWYESLFQMRAKILSKVQQYHLISVGVEKTEK